MKFYAVRISKPACAHVELIINDVQKETFLFIFIHIVFYKNCQLLVVVVVVIVDINVVFYLRWFEERSRGYQSCCCAC